MATEELTEIKKIFLEMGTALREKGRYGKAYTAKQIGDLIATAVQDQAHGSTAAVEVDITYPIATAKGIINLTDPDVTLYLDEIALENASDPKATRVKLAKQIKFREEIREKNPVKLAAYEAFRSVVMGLVDDPQTLIAYGMQGGLDGLKQQVQITGVALKIQPNGAFGAIVSGKPKE